MEKSISFLLKVLGLITTSPSFNERPKSIIMSFNTVLEAVPVKAIIVGFLFTVDLQKRLIFVGNCRYAGLKSCPHSDTQWASSITAKLIKAGLFSLKDIF